jgi:hypothetical protein
LIFFFTSFFVEGHVFVLIEHKPDSIIVFETFTEFAIEFADRLEEGGGDRSKSGGAFGTNAALGDGKEETGEGMGERAGGHEIVAEWVADFSGAIVRFEEVKEFSIVKEAEFGSRGA